jgi:FkbM family methyltransferase
MPKVLFSEHELLERLPYQQAEPRILIDVGAHIGNFSRRFLAMGWQVVAFEPDADNFATLHKRFATYPGSSAIQKAVSDHTGRTKFYVSDAHWGIHSLQPFHATHTRSVEVDMTRLDDALDQARIGRVTVLKIDAEGADFPALRSFPFHRLQPEVVMAEFMDGRSQPHFGYTHHDMVAFMNERGYAAYVAEWAPVVSHSKKGGGGGPFIFLQCVPYPLQHTPAWGNLIFVAPERREMFETTLNQLLIDLEDRRDPEAASRLSTAKEGPIALAPWVRKWKGRAKEIPGARKLLRYARRSARSFKSAHQVHASPDSARFARQTEPGVELSIVVAAHNAQDVLSECLSSIQAQTHPAFECIVVDDRSSDATFTVAQRLTRKDPRFRVLRHGTETGCPAIAKNTGASAATGSLLWFLDATDSLIPTAVEALLGRAQLTHDVPGAAGVYLQGPQGETTSPPILDYLWAVPHALPHSRTLAVQSVLFRRMGGFDESLASAGQADFFYRLLRHGFFFLPANNDGFLEGSLRGPLDDVAATVRLYEDVERDWPEENILPDTPFVYRHAIEGYRRVFWAKRALLVDLGRSPPEEAFAYRVASRLALSDFGDYRNALLPEVHIAMGMAERSGRPAWDFFEFIDKAKKRCAVLEQVVARTLEEPPPPEAATDGPSELRRRTLRQASKQRSIEIAFAPHKDYHVWTMAKAARRLAERGVPFVFVDSTANHRDEGARGRIEAYGLPSVSYNNYRLGAFHPRILLVMNDWETQIRTLVDEAAQAGVITVGLVEGVQDFTDADIGRDRRPYRRVQQMLLSGAFDEQFFPASTPTRVVGVPRIDELRSEENAFPDEPMIVANANFSYGVLTEKRDMWIESVAAACKALGVRMVVSRHPADHGDYSRFEVTSLSMYDAIRQGSVFVSRFGSGIIEALAMGKPAIYHNPHHEKVIKFQEPLGAYPVTTDVESLTEALRHTLKDRSDRRVRAKAFLDHHVAWSALSSASDMFADALVDLCAPLSRSA